MKAWKQILNGIIDENPTLVQLLGMCPTLAVTTSVVNGLGMGLSATAVLIASNVAISSLRKFIPAKIRIAAYVVIIAGFVSIIDMLLQAYFPDIAASLGIFIPLIVVNCIILARAEAFASKNPVGLSAADGLGMGLGFTMALLIMSSIREILGSGTLVGFQVLPEGTAATIFILPPGGFMVLGIIIGVVALFKSRKGRDA